MIISNQNSIHLLIGSGLTLVITAISSLGYFWTTILPN